MSETTPQADLQARWAPSQHQLDVAAAMLAAAPAATHVLVPIAQPGKVHGIWQVGQPVEHPGGFWLATNRNHAPHFPYREARDAAEYAASRHLGDRDGTPGYVTIDRDGNAGVFEGFRLDRDGAQ